MTTLKNNYLPKMERELEKMAKEHREREEILVTGRRLQPRVGANTVRTLTNQGFPQHFEHEYESCEWDYGNGLVFKPDEFLKELKPEVYGEKDEGKENSNE